MTLAHTGLPVEDVMVALRAALAATGHAVLVAPPGAGKTTVVPLRLADEPWLGGRKVVVLEPRRLATRAAARRMAQLLGEDVGDTVGYRTRDDRRVGPHTRVEVVTEGILTRWLQRDPELPGVGCVVFDEFHERNLQTDLGLALTLDVRRSIRPDLRVLVMSATLLTDRVASLLGAPDGPPAPVVASETRAHPVDVRWMPPGPRERIEPAVAAAVRRALHREAGDVLVFLPGAGEIARVAELLGDEPVDVRPLHGMLAATDQDAAILPGPFRKVVLATDIAETSLTVEGVRVVVDSGLARAPRFDARTGMTRLRQVPISRASADQRAGRAGRTEPGVAYRLWSRLDHGTRRAEIDPEITQVDLSGLVLELAAWGSADLPFLDPPPARAVEEGRSLLRQLDALDDAGHLTPTGRAMAELPLHPRLAHMVVRATPTGDGGLACLLAALLEDRDVLRGRPDDVPVDLGLRLALLADRHRRHPMAEGRALTRTRQRAHDLARRVGVNVERADADHAGRVLALAYPDRLAVRRGSPGKFQLRTGSSAWLRPTDPLAAESFLVAADLDGNRRDARIRLAAALGANEVGEAFAAHVVTQCALTWDRERDDLVERVERRIGGMVLDTATRRPSPGPAAVAALLELVRATRLAALDWSPAAAGLRDRVRFAHQRLGSPWPDWSDRTLLATLEDWLGPFLAGATGRADLEQVDVAAALGAALAFEQRQELDRLAPTHLVVPSGRRVLLDYSGDTPVLAVPVQELFGSSATPTVLDGAVPVVLHLLTPAGRPLQVTSDLAGFWAGSWHDARRQLAGRYPKHAWPVDPANAEPTRR